MRILFDQGTPVPLREHLPGHSVETAYEMGWSALRNGELLANAEAEFDLLITTDRNLRDQQNLCRPPDRDPCPADNQLAAPAAHRAGDRGGRRLAETRAVLGSAVLIGEIGV